LTANELLARSITLASGDEIQHPQQIDQLLALDRGLRVVEMAEQAFTIHRP
jgi:hypothetical protein